MINDLSPKQAWQKFQQEENIIILDVRTSMEFSFIGHPIGATHVPLMEAPDWELDADFVQQVIKTLGDTPSTKDQTLLTLCRSGKRSLAAAQLLEVAGFTSLYNIVEGFEGDLDDNKHRGKINGWRFHQLPWQQS